MLSPCLNVSLVNARLHYCRLAAEASVSDLGLWQCDCQVGFIEVNDLFFFPLIVLCSVVKMHMAPRC